MSDSQRPGDQTPDPAKGPETFSDAWNYENKPPQPVPEGFESVWKFTKGRDKR